MSYPAENEVTAVWPAARDRNERLALVLDRYMRELETSGLPPDVDRLIQDHPDLADELRSYVDSLQMLHQMTTGMRAPAPPQAGATFATAPESAKRLGDYEIVREIGRGGMGVVYEARQLSLNRQVALKVLPFAAMLDERQIARFRTEAQAAAQLHHPNIVPVYAVGQERGVHYFAMQYIAGQSLDCALNELRGSLAEATPTDPARTGGDASTLLQRDRDTVIGPAFSTRVSTRTRTYCHSVARLILQAAEALDHAHTLGVLHRDIKPSNLLLDRNGKLWITDFGLARIQTDSGVTISGDIVGTIRYMSPEQAAGAPALVDARSDVYALGATLYELLTLQPAHRGDARQEILHNIESVDPPPPRSVNPSVPFDLETITIRAMSKARDERYSTAQEFADDLRRFLAGEPTRARRPTTADRAWKWALRHRRSVAVAASFLLVLTVVSATAAVMLARGEARTRAALETAKSSFVQADEDFHLAREVVDRFSSNVSNELAGLPGAEPLRRKLLQDALEYYRSFAARAASDPQLAAEMASAFLKAAIIAETLGDRADALAMCRQALAAYERLVADSPKDTELQAQRANAYSSLGLLLAAEGNSKDALRSYAAAIAVQTTLADSEPGNGAAERSLAETYSNLGLLEAKLGDKERARTSLNASIELLDDLLAQSPADAQLRHDAAIGYNNLSFVQRGEDWQGSQKSCDQAIDILARLVKEQPSSLTYRSDLALCHNNHGAILSHRKDWQAACKSYQQAIELQRQLVRQAGAVVGYRRDLAVSLNNLGQAQQELGQLPSAIATFDDAEQIVMQLAGDYPNELTFRSLAGAVLNNRAMALEAGGQVDASLPIYERAIANQSVAYQRASQIPEYREFLSKHYFNYGRALRTAGLPQRAAEAALERRKLWPDHGEHLGQVAIELAQAVTQLRAESDAEAPNRAAELERQTRKTLRLAASNGANLAELRASKALNFLQGDAFWAGLTNPAGSLVQ
jgi:serine/threonine protein kinase/tetratricopeptide (TPR) repeat protein